jgi:hypothetical protein
MESGVVVLGGPFATDLAEPICGAKLLCRGAGAAERRLLEQDPKVQAGHLRNEYATWRVPKAVAEGLVPACPGGGPVSTRP